MAEAIKAEIDIEAPIRDVFDQWSRLEELPRFMSMVKRVERIDHDRTHWVVNVGGVEREFDARTTDVVQNDHIAWASEGEKIHSGVVRFSPVDAECTHVSLEMAWVPETLLEKAGAMLHIDERAAEKDLRRFKDIVEGREGIDRSAGEHHGEHHERGTDHHERGTDPDIAL